MRVVFFGSPDFAVASLQALLASRHQVVGVITQPDRPAGRGMELSPSAVKLCAQAANLPIFQPEKLNREETYAWLKAQKPDVLAVVAYGEFLGQRLLSFCKTPPINVHPSLLPELRGAAPMQWALLRGFSRSGVTTQFMTKEMDAGDILLQEESALGPNENAEELQSRFRLVGGRLLVETLDRLEAGQLRPRPQGNEGISFAPLLSKEQGLIRWANESAQVIHNKVRGLYPWPSAYTFWQGKRCKILQTVVPNTQEAPQRSLSPGQFMGFGDALFVRAEDTWLKVLRLQPEGKRALLPREFVNGINSSQTEHAFDAPGGP